MATGELSLILGDDAAVVQAVKKLETPMYRRFVRGEQGGPPRMFGAEEKGKTGILISALDLTAGMMGQPVDGIRGYEPAAATAIVEQCLMGALKSGAATAATTAPATSKK